MNQSNHNNPNLYLHEQFGYAYDAAWNLNWRTNDQFKQQFQVNNRNELTGSSRSGTLTVSGTAGLRKAQCRRHRPARIAAFPSEPSTINHQQSTAFSGIGGLLARSEITNHKSPHAYYHADGNGNVTCLVDTTGTIVARYTYDPYGNILSMSGPLAEANLYRFSSKEAHQNSGLVYYLYRYYEPNLQRWINRDPLEEEGGVNLYEPFVNSPTIAFDSYGFSACSEFIDRIMSDIQQSDNINMLGKQWLDARQTTLRDASGFRESLVAGGQNGAVSRHFYGHVGAILWGQSAAGLSPGGYIASYIQQGVDWIDPHLPRSRKSQEEANAEVESDRASRRAAERIRDFWRKTRGSKLNDCADLQNLRDALKNVFCDW